jgi:hypothetical protein
MSPKTDKITLFTYQSEPFALGHSEGVERPKNLHVIKIASDYRDSSLRSE